MGQFSKAKDATRSIGVLVKQCHWNKAKPFDGNKCAIGLAGRDQFDDCKMLRNYAFFKIRGKWVRTYAGAAARLIAALLDKGNKKNLILPEGGVRVMFDPPKGVRSQKYLQSARFRAVRAASRAKRAGQPKRVYRRTDSVSLEDIRHGRGLYV